MEAGSKKPLPLITRTSSFINRHHIISNDLKNEISTIPKDELQNFLGKLEGKIFHDHNKKIVENMTKEFNVANNVENIINTSPAKYPR